jgi:hypothetical protein
MDSDTKTPWLGHWQVMKSLRPFTKHFDAMPLVDRECRKVILMHHLSHGFTPSTITGTPCWF